MTSSNAPEYVQYSQKKLPAPLTNTRRASNVTQGWNGDELLCSLPSFENRFSCQLRLAAYTLAFHAVQLQDMSPQSLSSYRMWTCCRF